MEALEHCLTFGLVLAALTVASAEEPDDSRIIKRILQTRDEIVRDLGASNSRPSPAFLVFWDFDGTILKGDCTEGLEVDGKRVYPGLAQVTIEHGLSSLYAPQGGFERFWTDYTYMGTHIGAWLCCPFVLQMLRGAKVNDVLELSRRYFAGTLSKYLMASSVKIIRALEQGGVEQHIITTSPDLFVTGSAESLGLPASHIHGIEVRARDGRLTEEIVYPVAWNIGKLEKLQTIVAQMERESPGRKVFVLAGFGDSYATDGPFLKFIASQSLPAGKPIAVFYNSEKEPDEYRGLFYHARHSRTVSDPPNP